LEGDIDAVAGEDIYLMIGVQGEVYPILREKFEKSYQPLADPYHEETEYIPALLNRGTGERREISSYAKTCLPKDSKWVRAKPLEKDTKVFTAWDIEKYFLGLKGDYLVANEGDFNDCYIVRKDIFLQTYTSAAGDVNGFGGKSPHAST
jgi:phosphoglycolate phosphatase